MPIATANPSNLYTGTIIRPSGTPSAYSAGDIWGKSDGTNPFITFENVVPVEGGSGWIFSVMAFKSGPNSAVMTFHLFNAEPAAIIATVTMADHVAFAFDTAADSSKYICPITGISMTTDAGGTNDVAKYFDDNRHIAFTCAAGSKNLYIRPVINYAFNPLESEALTVKLGILH